MSLRKRALLILAIVFGWAVLVGIAAALAHDHWINHSRLVDPVTNEWCCNEHDCDLIDAGGVVEQNGDYFIVETQETFPAARVIWKSGDGRWWRCRYLGGENAGKTRCLIGPPPGS